MRNTSSNSAGDGRPAVDRPTVAKAEVTSNNASERGYRVISITSSVEETTAATESSAMVSAWRWTHAVISPFEGVHRRFAADLGQDCEQ